MPPPPSMARKKSHLDTLGGKYFDSGHVYPGNIS
jgi:hypothetical protein